ncbi:MAG: CotS family spore coat protein [Epulopiscium sp.]|nr:CotS family spore coat protein [Candidatus Epulonipiscium sp.]
MKSLCSEVVKGFGYKLKSYTAFRNLYICNTNLGIKVIKVVENNIPRLLFQYSVKEHLYNNGFKSLDSFHLSLENKPYYIYQDNIYVMTNWLEGRECDFNNLEDIKKAILTLGDMHKISKGLVPVEGSLLRSFDDDLPFIIKKRIREFNTMKKKINRQSHMTNFDLLFLKNYKRYEEYSLRALEWIEKVDYERIRIKVEKEKYFCHNDYTYHNLILLPAGPLYVTNFEKCKYGFPIYDLVYILKKIMKRHKWDTKIADELISLYDKKIDIKEIKNILVSLLIFPDDFWKICNRYYNSRRSWAFQSPVNKLTFIINQKENQDKFIKYVETL